MFVEFESGKGNIEFWVRNLVRKEGCSFYLQKGNGRIQILYVNYLMEKF
jgi:type III restriction enzyme